MKKTYITNENASETFTLYVGIDAVYGGWIMETSGDPTCLNELEESVSDGNESAEALINSIGELISDPATPWEPLSFEDKEYIRFTLESWGL